MTTYRGFPKFPAPRFQKGDRVRYEYVLYTVVAGTHTHTQLEGVEFAIPNWQLKTYRRLKKTSVKNQDCV